MNINVISKGVNDFFKGRILKSKAHNRYCTFKGMQRCVSVDAIEFIFESYPNNNDYFIITLSYYTARFGHNDATIGFLRNLMENLEDAELTRLEKIVYDIE